MGSNHMEIISIKDILIYYIIIEISHVEFENDLSFYYYIGTTLLLIAGFKTWSLSIIKS